MKKTGIFLLALVLMLSLVACTEKSKEEALQNEVSDQGIESTDISEETEGVSENRVLIAYFGRWGNTEFSNDVDASTSASIVVGKDGNLQGTTEYVAELIQEYTGGDLHLIKTAEPYPVDYDTVVDQNHQEQEDGFVPELESTDLNVEQYDTVFIGYPIWATTIPQPVVSFLEQYDLSGKTVIPFCTHAGYGSGSSYEDIQALCPDSEVLDGCAVEAEEISTAEQEVPAWLDELQLVQENLSNAEASKNSIR